MHRLIEGLPFPQELIKPIGRINPAYTTARYPDAVNGVPIEAFDDESAGRHVEDAQRVLEWVKSQLDAP